MYMFYKVMVTAVLKRKAQETLLASKKKGNKLVIDDGIMLAIPNNITLTTTTVQARGAK